ncbi:MAG: hypothetical protein KA383_04055 [Phycisphaerae bacterium]|nr:hypothetical protein [Phycisphaerae bacterium]
MMRSDMSERPWILPPAVVAGMVAVLVVCFAVAECTGFYLRTPDTRALDHWLWQGLFLWPFVGLAAGGIMHGISGRPPREARLWPVIVPPLLAAVWLAAAEGGEQYRRYVEARASGIPRYSFWWDIGIPLIGVAMPLVAWGMMSLPLWAFSRAWRLPITPGKCPTCDYDLTGNTSGVCPECGTRIVSEQSIPHWYYKSRFGWLPELAQFSDASARYAACKSAAKECKTWSRLALFVAAVLIVFESETWLPAGSERCWTRVQLAVLAMSVPVLWLERRRMRRALRRQLAARDARPPGAAKP